MRLAALILGIAAAGYLAVAALAWAFQAHLIYFPNPAAGEPPQGSPFTAVQVDTEDGETLAAWRAAARPGCPTLLLLHGNAGHVPSSGWLYEQLNRAGAGVLALSWRGYAGSTGTPSEAGLYADAEAGFMALIEDGTPAGEIVVHGFSLGSAPAVRLAADHDFNALILEAPFLSAEAVARESMPFLPVGWLLRDRYRTDEMIADVDMPILIVHGAADTIIPARHSERLAALARAPVTRILIDNAGHNTLAQNGMYETAVWPFLSDRFPDCRFAAEEVEV
ncbi:alpha/beta hydrolase [Alkalicaulis satelles]|uniref:Alpha/beta hydrolase n=1 Tax=Alkalicaulis satelles TaxID=2609175 RepID=A0A5M6ZPZ2_9PROT|nr:alpha/beta hydrolase [Alkalicaulis satelles]KAA5805318.1 alpha/beta hydrolase [Alkalicaulis satelles]